MIHVCNSVLGSLWWEDYGFKASMCNTVSSRPSSCGKLCKLNPRTHQMLTSRTPSFSLFVSAEDQKQAVEMCGLSILSHYQGCRDIHLGASPEMSVPSVLQCPQVSPKSPSKGLCLIWVLLLPAKGEAEVAYQAQGQLQSELHTALPIPQRLRKHCPPALAWRLTTENSLPHWVSPQSQERQGCSHQGTMI